VQLARLKYGTTRDTCLERFVDTATRQASARVLVERTCSAAAATASRTLACCCVVISITFADMRVWKPVSAARTAASTSLVMSDLVSVTATTLHET
jgi:hypothetical protein